MGPEHVPHIDAGWPDRLDRYYAGRSSAEEHAAVEAYLAEHLEVARFFDTLRGELARPHVQEPDFRSALVRLKQPGQGKASVQKGSSVSDSASALVATADLERRRPEELVSEVMEGRGRALHYKTLAVRRRWKAWTAGLAIGIAVITLVMTGTITRRWWNATPQQQTGAISYITRPGQRAEIELSDGTHVALNVGSRLDVSSGFGRTSRTVHIIGEAYFRVARSSGVPFLVDAGQTHATVLGTEFAVRAYDTSDVRVAVKSGKISVGRAVLIANDVAHVTSGGVMTIASHQNLGAALGFVTGKLVLNNVPLRTVIPDLDRWYNADIQLGDASLGDKPIEASLVSGSIGDLKELLQVIFDVRVVQHGRTLTLYPR
jgi:transmembrane sensor